VRELYGEAAETPQAELCCPTKYDPAAVDHVPQEVLDRFYGCGSPLAAAGIEEGETVLDLGSGAGIDVFVAARAVGPGGRAIGVDMTDEMLAVARDSQPKVAAALGYDVVDFRRGFLEEIPVESKTVDLVTSNCVINLSPDKPRVLEEIWRVLRDHGRMVVSDIVSDRPVPPHLKVDPRLWGECLVGALTEAELLAGLERAGFYGVEVLKKTYWKEVEGHAFWSLTVRGWKFEKTAGCVFQGHRAVYLGPGKAFVDEEGHQFPRNEPYEVCTDTVAKLSRPPYSGFFAILEPGDDRAGYACCEGEGCC
jgi:SAM-dependent methyltransferase